MLNKNMSKAEIEAFLKNKGDYVQIDHLSRFIKEKDIPVDKKRFVYQKLAELYESKGMFTESAKMYNNLSISSNVFTEKIKYHLKEAELHVKSGFFDWADEAVKKSLSEANSSQRAEINFEVKGFYKKNAEECEKNKRRGQAVKIYEKMLQMNISDQEREEIKKKLLELYKSLGRLKEYFAIKGREMTRTGR